MEQSSSENINIDLDDDSACILNANDVQAIDEALDISSDDEITENEDTDELTEGEKLTDMAPNGILDNAMIEAEVNEKSEAKSSKDRKSLISKWSSTLAPKSHNKGWQRIT